MHFFLLIIASITPQAFAQQVPVRLLSEDIAIEEVVSNSASHAYADLNGDGGSMTLAYTTAKPLSVLIVYKHLDGSFNTFDTLQTVLPAGENLEATINLTKSPGWSAGNKNYRLYFFSEAEAGAVFHDIEFMRASFFTTLKAAAHHISMIQPYSPASYHRLPGYTVLGVPLTPVVGFLLIGAVGLLALCKRYSSVISFIVIAVLCTQLRFSIDALAISVDHSREWLSNKTYATAGSLPIIGKRLREEDATSAYLCHTGTTYAQRLLQYHSYPVLLSQNNPSHIIVHRSVDSTLNGNVLTCGDKEFTVKLLETYNDGSALYLRNS